MDILRSALRDPLMHFLLAGGLIFALFALWGRADPRSGDDTTITVDRAALINFLQYRSNAFEPARFEAAFDAMGADEKRALAQSYVQEEAMVREASAMGLDSADYVIRQRLVQKVLFLADPPPESLPAPTQADLAAHFKAHAEEYRSPPAFTFAHVFVDDAVPHPGGGEAEARRILAGLRANAIGFNQATAYGDRYPYALNLVGRDPDFIANQFGRPFADALLRLAPGPQWQGPVRSQFGWHLVMLTARQDSAAPALAQVRDRVLADLMERRAAAARQASLDELLGQYSVRYQGLPELEPGAGKK